jgi:hypothetical protein
LADQENKSKQEEAVMNGGTTIVIRLPASLLRSFRVVAAWESVKEDEVCRRIICGLSGLTDADLRSLPEPPREHRYLELKIELDWRSLDRLSDANRVSKMTNSSIFRRILYAFLITRKVHFVPRDNANEFCIGHTQMHFEFAGDSQNQQTISASRQHREQP